jgi:hypothetical protein
MPRRPTYRIVKTRPCAVCGEPLEIRYPKCNLRTHPDCGVAFRLRPFKERIAAPFYRQKRATP